jgi:hypothetical protein
MSSRERLHGFQGKEVEFQRKEKLIPGKECTSFRESMHDFHGKDLRIP